MPKTDAITQTRLKELLHYDPDTGVFTWLQRTTNSVQIGDVAGTQNKSYKGYKGYIRIAIDGVLYLAHRLAFLYQLGWIPIEIDHDDQIKHNNRWANLNPSTRTLNRKNHPLSRANTSGT